MRLGCIVNVQSRREECNTITQIVSCEKVIVPLSPPLSCPLISPLKSFSIMLQTLLNTRRSFSSFVQTTLKEKHGKNFAYLTLNRPESHNAMNDDFMTSFRAQLDVVAESDAVACFLDAEGASFCAGGDLKWMKAGIHHSKDKNIEDAYLLSGLFKDLSLLPMPTVCLIQGAVYGGGLGLVTACDIAVSVPDAKFKLSEVKVGVIPATISPYVVRRIGASQAHRFFLTGEMFDADKVRVNMSRSNLLSHPLTFFLLLRPILVSLLLVSPAPTSLLVSPVPTPPCLTHNHPSLSHLSNHL